MPGAGAFVSRVSWKKWGATTARKRRRDGGQRALFSVVTSRFRYDRPAGWMPAGAVKSR